MLRYKVSVKNKHTIVAKRNTLQISIYFLLTSLLLLPGHPSAEETITDKTLIVYYSRTAKSKLVCDVLQQHIGADILEVKDLKDRSGQWGYYSAGFDSVFNRYTQIEPETPDFSPYSSIIVISPV